MRPSNPLFLLLALALAGCGDGGGEPFEPRPRPVEPTPPFLPPGPYVPGSSYLGREGYIEYIAGDAPLIYTAAHGGALTPPGIPDRTSARCGEPVSALADLETADLARRMQQEHHARFGTWPHVVINHLHRRKLDAIAAYEDTASIATLSRVAPATLSALLRGGESLGTLYAANGFPAVPSAGDQAPLAGDSYFSGGYNTTRHGCGIEAQALGGASGGAICGVQVEANYAGVRDTDENRRRFAQVTAVVLARYLGTHWGIELGAAAGP